MGRGEIRFRRQGGGPSSRRDGISHARRVRSARMRLTLPDVGFAGAPIDIDLDDVAADVAIVGVPFGWPYPRPGPTVGCAMAPTAVSAGSSAWRASATTGTSTSARRCSPRRPRVVDVGDVPGDATDGPGNSSLSEAAIKQILDVGGADRHRRRRLRRDPDPARLRRSRAADDPPRRRAPGLPRRGLRHSRGLLVADAPRVRDGACVAHRAGRAARRWERPRAARSTMPARRGTCSSPRASSASAAWHRCSTRFARDASVFVAFDTDGLDPSVCPAVSAPAPGGLSWDEASDLPRRGRLTPGRGGVHGDGAGHGRQRAVGPDRGTHDAAPGRIAFSRVAVGTGRGRS